MKAIAPPCYCPPASGQAASANISYSSTQGHQLGRGEGLCPPKSFKEWSGPLQYPIASCGVHVVCLQHAHVMWAHHTTLAPSIAGARRRSLFHIAIRYEQKKKRCLIFSNWNQWDIRLRDFCLFSSQSPQELWGAALPEKKVSQLYGFAWIVV